MGFLIHREIARKLELFFSVKDSRSICDQEKHDVRVKIVHAYAPTYSSYDEAFDSC